MADPVSMLVMFGMSAATAGTVVATASTVASIAGPVLGLASGVQKANEAKAQAGEYRREGREARVSASIEAARMRREARIRQSADRTTMAEGGALSGTAFGVLDQNAVAQELDALTVEYQGKQAGASADFRAREAMKGASPLNIFASTIEGFSTFDPLNLGGHI